ncbi:MAG: DUF2920 family protein [Synergistaceae bacterium]|nr:DUF2920 family protein [Synergistaceae bacterium]
MPYEKISFQPHKDVELNRERSPIELLLTIPDNGINEDTGLIFLVNEFGTTPDKPEYIESIHPALAKEHNCAVASVSYFGILRNDKMDITDAFLHNLNRIYNLKLTREVFKSADNYFDAFRIVAQIVAERGVTSVDLRCQPIMVTGRGEYQSWGFLPAIDCLTAIGQVLKKYPLNTRRLYAAGQFYGGYVASLMGKYAPHTFTTIIDKSGYSKSETRHILCGETLEEDLTVSFGMKGKNYDFTLAVCANNPWTILDETSPNYFSDSHREIRSLLIDKHFVDSGTKFILYAAKNDDSYIKHMETRVDIMKKYYDINYEKVATYENTPLEKLTSVINHAHDNNREYFSKELPATDFSLGSTHVFDCAGKKYIFRYGEDYSLRISIE